MYTFKRFKPIYIYDKFYKLNIVLNKLFIKRSVRRTDMYLSQINYIKHVTDRQTDRHDKQLYWLCVTEGQTCI